MDLDRITRLKQTVKALADSEITQGQEQYVSTYQRVRAEVADAVDDAQRQELDRLFPAEVEEAQGAAITFTISTAREAQRRLAGIAGWLDGMIEAAVLDQRIQAEAEALARERTKQTGFR